MQRRSYQEFFGLPQGLLPDGQVFQPGEDGGRVDAVHGRRVGLIEHGFIGISFNRCKV